ncbi:MAG TPA: hypothetical protein PKN36_02105 [bacterium]|nr:hypothetical protein [bacterium]
MKTLSGPRIIRSPWSDFYGREIEDSLKTHPENYLREVSAQGFNSIWVHCILRDIVNSDPFPEFGRKAKEQVPALNRLVERAGKYGLKVFVYICEPRGFSSNDAFWQKNSDVRGHLSAGNYALCSSAQRVKDFLSQSSYNLFKKVPGLGGAFMITASEFHTHCYSHYPKWQKLFAISQMTDWAKAQFHCERCAERDPSQVVAEIVTLVNSGIKSASPRAETIVWNWSWYIIEPDPQKKLVSLLPDNITLMADFERGGSIKVLDKKINVDEYSFSYTGPSKRFKDILSQARERKMKMMAKIQLGTTHELVTVPYIPVPCILAEKISRMRKAKVNGYLGCWIFGGDVTPMSRIAGKMSIDPDISASKAVKEVAISEFGDKETAGYVSRAWKLFSKAWKNYPFSIPFLYNSPVNYSTTYPLTLDAGKAGIIPSWRPLPRDKDGHLAVGENLETWTKPFTPYFVSRVFRKLLKEWNKGIEILREGEIKSGGQNKRYNKELDMAVHISLLVESTVDIIEFYRLLGLYRKNKKDRKTITGLKKLFEKQISIAEKDREIIGRNRDFGYHPEAHEFFVRTKDLDYKIDMLGKQLEAL